MTMVMAMEKFGSILKLTSQRSKPIVFGITLLLWFIYSQVLPPRKLRHIPHVNYLKFMFMSIIQKQPFGVIAKALTLPLLVNSPMYTKMDRDGWSVFVADPVAAKQIFLKPDIYAKEDEEIQKGTLFHYFLGTKNILFAHEKDEWKKHRKLLNPAFKKSKPLKIFGTLAHKVFKVIDQVGETPLNVAELMERYTLDIIGQAGFGFDFNSIMNPDSELGQVYNGIKEGITHPAFFLFPILDTHFRWLFPNRSLRYRQVNQFHDMLSDVIENKRYALKNQLYVDDDSEKDLLALMLESELTEGERILTDEEIKSNLNVFFFAGHDTTANALSFAIHALARDPVLQQKARDEAIRVLGDEPHDVLPTQDDLKQFEYIHQIIKETLRFNGPATNGMPRQVMQDTTLMGYHLPKNTIITCSMYDMHHNPKVWNDPERYDPDRFAPGGEAEEKINAMESGAFAWAPFFNGQHTCIGMQFSLDEQKVMLSCMLRKYEWKLPENSIHKENVVTGTIGILTPKNLEIIFKKRY